MPLPGKTEGVAGLGCHVAADEFFQYIFRKNPVRLETIVRIKRILFEVETVPALEIAERPDRFHQNMKPVGLKRSNFGHNDTIM